jgi:hypothetical protein
MKHRNVVSIVSLLSIFGLMLLLPGTPVVAQEADPPVCTDTLIVEHFKIEFIERVPNRNEDTSTYVYAVTANPDGGPTGQRAMSHWGIQFCDWFFDDPTSVTPQTGTFLTPGVYTTTTKTPNYSVPGRLNIAYSVNTATDTPYIWLKWDGASAAEDLLGNDSVTETDVFTVTVANSIVYQNALRVPIQLGPIGVQVKAGPEGGGGGTQSEGLCGPWAKCDDPSSVCFVGFEAKSPSLIGWVLGLLGLK